MSHDYDLCHRQCVKYIRWFVFAVQADDSFALWYRAEWIRWDDRRRTAHAERMKR